MPTSSFSRHVWRVSLPIILVEATETIDHLIDTLFLARVGITELGAIGVADALMLLFLILPLAMTDGVQILTARRVGQRRPGAVGAAFNQGLLLVLALGFVAAAALKMLSPVITTWLVQTDAVGEAVDSYLQWDAYSIPLTGVTFAYSALLISLGRTRVLVLSTILLVVTDVVLNYLFIFGKFGCPALGIRGAAVGSIGAELVTVLFLTGFVARRFAAQYQFLRFRAFEPRLTRLLGRLSAPIAAQCVVGDIRWAVFFLIIERLGTSALAVANTVFTFYLVFRIPTEGFAETACSLVSRYIGRGRFDRIGEAMRKTTSGALLATVPFILAALAAPHLLVGMVSPEAGLIESSTASLRVVALAMLIAIPAELWFTAVLGTGDTLAALLIDLLLTLIMLGLTWIAAIGLGWPMAFIWLAVPLAWLVCLAASYGWMKSGIWKRIEV